MANDSRYRMSREQLEKLKEELELMQTVKAKEVAEQIKEARSFGDLSENSEYDEAKTEQGKLYSRIAEVQDLIENAEIVEVTIVEGVVGHGSHVTIRDIEMDETEEYRIVGSQEANPSVGLISSDSPIGRALLGHHVGDTVVVEAPAGQIEFEIVETHN